jgi:hypothetical protein
MYTLQPWPASLEQRIPSSLIRVLPGKSAYTMALVAFQLKLDGSGLKLYTPLK